MQPTTSSPSKKRARKSIGALPTGRAIDVLVTSLLKLDNELSAIDMDHAVRTQYRFVVNKWLETNEGNVIQLLMERVASQDQKGEKARRVLNEIIHKIPPLNAEDHHHHHGHAINTLPDVNEERVGHIGLVKQNTVEHMEEMELETKNAASKESKESKLNTENNNNNTDKDIANNHNNTNGVASKMENIQETKVMQTDTHFNLNQIQDIAPDWENTDYAGDALKKLDQGANKIKDAVADVTHGTMMTDKAMGGDHRSAEEFLQQHDHDWEHENGLHVNEMHDDRPWTKDTAIDGLMGLDPRLKDNVYDDEIELFLLSHLTIEKRQLRSVTIALCCGILFKTWSKTPRFFHLNRTCNALMRVIYTHPDQHLSIYTTEDPKEYESAVIAASNADLLDGGGTWNEHGKTSPIKHNHGFEVPSLADLLSNVPYASIVRDLEPQVEALVKQRQLMSAAQVNALARRESRKRAILRTAAKWQANMLHQNFVQWHNMTRTLKEQRVKLVSHFLTMHTPKIKDIFDAWHIISINQKLDDCEEARGKKVVFFISSIYFN